MSTESPAEPEILPVTDAAAEAALVAACIESPSARSSARVMGIRAETIYDPVLADLWSLLTDMDRDRKPVDPNTLLLELHRRPNSEKPIRALTELILRPGIFAANVETYASMVLEWAARRDLYAAGTRIRSKAGMTGYDTHAAVSEGIRELELIRNHGHIATDDPHLLTLEELLALEDKAEDWIIPGLLERRDRLMLTGMEGLGKSHLLRQVAVSAAYGLDPFDCEVPIRPVNVLVIDAENSSSQAAASTRRLANFYQRINSRPVTPAMTFRATEPMNITSIDTLGQINSWLDATHPDLVLIGPLYKLHRGLSSNGDEDMSAVLAALDSIRERGCALLIEAHASLEKSAKGVRNLRPRGSSVQLGWPEFGYGMRGEADNRMTATLEPWRGDRSARNWPRNIRVANDGRPGSTPFRWIPNYADPNRHDDRDSWQAKA